MNGINWRWTKMKRTTICFIIYLLFGMWGHAFAMEVIPEMRECMRSHGSQKEYKSVIQKYADPAIVNQAMGLLIIKEPYITNADREGQKICYTVEGVTVETATEIPRDIVQTYKACWENRRIVSFTPLGAKKGIAVADIIPEMKECMQAHTSQKKYRAVISRYANSDIIRKAMGLLIIRDPYVIKTEKVDNKIYYTVEGITISTSSEMPADIVQVYRVGWQNGRIISLEIFGPKK
jgi:hypothetical protein